MQKAFNIILVIFTFMLFIGNCEALELDFEEYEAVDIHAFISQGYMCSNRYNFMADTDGGTFQFGEVGINFTKNVSDELRLGVQFVARDLGIVGNYEPYVDWAVADYRWRGWAGLRAGQIKMAYGLYNETRDIDMLRTSVFLPTGVYIESFRDAYNGLLGAGVYGDVPVDVAGTFSYQLSYGTTHFAADGGTSKMFESGTGFDITQNNNEECFNGSLQWISPVGLRLGYTLLLTGWDAKNPFVQPLDSGQISGGALPSGLPFHLHVDRTIHVRNGVVQTFSAEYMFQNLILAAEYYSLTLDTSIEYPTVVGYIQGFTADGPSTSVDGYYASASYRFNEWFELGGSYSWTTNRARDDDGKESAKQPGNHDYGAYLKDHALSMRFDITDNWIFKIEGHYMKGHAYVLNEDNPPYIIDPRHQDADPTNDVSYNTVKYPTEDWFMGAAKLSYSF